MGGDFFIARILRQAVRRISDIKNDWLVVYDDTSYFRKSRNARSSYFVR